MYLSEKIIGKGVQIPPTNNSIAWLENLTKKGFLDISRIGIAPMTTYFRDRAVALYDDVPYKFHILGETKHRLTIETRHLKSTLKKIKRFAKITPNLNFVIWEISLKQ